MMKTTAHRIALPAGAAALLSAALLLPAALPAADGRVYEYACHEGNYAMGNIMRGARLLEADAAAAAGGGE